MTRGRLLVVDDNPVNLKLLRVLLRAEGFDVATADDAPSALDALAEGGPSYDAVLVDIQLPGVDGLDLTRAVRADAAHPDLVVVAVTAYAMVGDEDRALRAGCDAYVTKPIDTRALPRLLDALITSRRAER